MEIERKFTVKALPEKLGSYKHVEIRQCYLSFGDEKALERRLRQTHDGKNSRYYLTEKGQGTLSRTENEREISSEEYFKMYREALTGDIEKTRYYIPLGGALTAELDIYHGALSGLFTVEVEFSDERDAIEFVPPSWFGKDITEDSGFKNKCLARFGIPDSFNK